MNPPIRFNSNLVCQSPSYNEEAGVCEDLSTPEMCESPSSATNDGQKERMLAEYQRGRVESLRSQFVANNFSQVPQAKSGGLGSVLAWGPLGILAATTGCANQGVQDAPENGPENSDPENPDPQPTPEDGLGTPRQDFAGSDCSVPADMAAAALVDSVMALCGDSVVSEGETGARLLEQVDPTTGEVDAYSIGESSYIEVSVGGGVVSVPVKNTSLVAPETGRYVVTMASAESPEKYLATEAIPSGVGGNYRPHSAVSGLRIININGVVQQTVHHAPLLFSFPPQGVPSSNHNLIEGETQSLVKAFFPNNAVDVVRAGDALWTLNANLVLNSTVAAWNEEHPAEQARSVVDYLPITIHGFSNGALEPLGVEAGELVDAMTNEPSNAIVLSGGYNPAGMAVIEQGNLAGQLVVVAQGLVNEQGVSHSDSKIFVVDPATTAVYEIPLNVSASNVFRATDQRGVALTTLDGEAHALVGSANGSGQVALVNLETEWVEFFGVFNDEALASSDGVYPAVAAVVTDPNDSRRVFVVSKPNEAGEVFATTLWLADDDTLGVSVGDRGPIKQVASGADSQSPVTARVESGALIVQTSTQFHRIPVVSAEDSTGNGN